MNQYHCYLSENVRQSNIHITGNYRVHEKLKKKKESSMKTPEIRQKLRSS